MINTIIPKFTYVVPFRSEGGNIITLKRVVDWISGFAGAEIIIIEQDEHSKISHLTFRAKHIFLKNPDAYNYAWAYNYVMKRFFSPIIIFGNYYTIMNPNNLIESLKIAENYDCVIPCSKSVILTPRESVMDYNGIMNKTNYSPKTHLMDGISIYKRDAIWKIGGWEEHAYNNDLFSIQEIKNNMLRTSKLDFSDYIFDHIVERLHPNVLERSSSVFQQVKSLDQNNMNQYINNSYSKIGIENKYTLV